MNRQSGLIWFARHEARLAARDLMAMLQGRHGRYARSLIAILIVSAIMHALAYVILSPLSAALLHPDKKTFVVIASSAFLSWALMLSQAMEAATRSFYARGDLDLILSSPFAGQRAFIIRIVAILVTTIVLATIVIGSFIDMAAFLWGMRFLSAYGVLVAMGLMATSIAIATTALLFDIAGPGRTRFLSQIASAVVGAGFLIGIQAAAVFSYNSLSSFQFLTSAQWIGLAPDMNSAIWLPVVAAMGHLWALAIVVGGSLCIFMVATWRIAGCFAKNALIVATHAAPNAKRKRKTGSFHVRSQRRSLLSKEWALLLRDPWLLSQCLMQILYLIPPALLMRQSFHGESTSLLLVPVVVLAAGQLAGGLAWLAISAEDAPDLIASAPVSASAVLSAKIQAVLIAVACPVLPLIVAMSFLSVRAASITAAGVCVATASACYVQFLFREQARRSHFRRRQTSSRIATFAEALISTLLAATVALFANGFRSAIIPALMAGAILLTVRQMMRSRRHAA